MRLQPEQRVAQILNAGAELADIHNLYETKLWHVASFCYCSQGTIIHYFKGIHQWRMAVVQHAIQCEQLQILAQAIVARDPLVNELSADLTKRALMSQVSK